MNEAHRIAKNVQLAQITIYDQIGCATVQAPVHEISHLLASARSEFEIGAKGSLNEKLVMRPFLSVDRPHIARVHSGLVPMIVDTLRAAGIEPEIKHAEPPLEPLHTNPSFLRRLKQPWTAFAKALENNPEGTIRVPGNRGLLQALGILCHLYPQSPILIYAATIEQTRFLQWKLRSWLGENIQLHLRRQSAFNRIVVSTFIRPIRPKEFAIVIAPFAHELGGDKAWETLINAFRGVRRRYAFVHNFPTLNHQEALTAQGLFGPEIWSLESYRHSSVRVLCCNAFDFAPVRGSQGLEFKRAAIWNNEHRNRVIARAAQAMLSKDMNELWQLGLMLKYEAFPITTKSNNWRVAVLAETTEHATVLSECLGGWPVMQVQPDSTGPAWNGSGAEGCIVTLSCAAQQGLHSHVLLRADGGGPIDLPGFPIGGTSPGMLVEFNTAAEQREALHRRLRDYLRRGWTVELLEEQKVNDSYETEGHVAGAGDIHAVDNANTDAGLNRGHTPKHRSKARGKGRKAKHRKGAKRAIANKTGRQEARKIKHKGR